MPELSRSQIAVYGAVAVALLLLGARAIRAEGNSGQLDPSFSSSGDREFTLDSGGSGGDVVVDVLPDGPERVGPRLNGEPVIGGHRAKIRDAVQTE